MASINKLPYIRDRFEESYDLSDEECMQWLCQTHPDDDDDLSFVDYFPDIPIATPVAMGSELSMKELVPANNGTLPSDSPQD